MQQIQPMMILMFLMMIVFVVLVVAAIVLVIWVISRSGHGATQFHRSQENRVIAGVAGGFAEYTDLSSAVVRIVWVLLAIFPMTAPFALLLYLILTLVLPSKAEQG